MVEENLSSEESPEKKSRRASWARNVACVGDVNMRTIFKSEKLNRQGHNGDQGIDKRIILNYIFIK
jgi:hypothetical protein